MGAGCVHSRPGPFLDLAFEYRAPAPLPGEGAGAPSLDVSVVDAALAELPAVVELLAD